MLLKEKMPSPRVQTILWVFGLTKIFCLVWFQPLCSEFTDYQYPLLELTRQGYFPFLDYWLEYPPLFAWLAVGIYWLSQLMPLGSSGPSAYGLYMGILMIIAEVSMLYFLWYIAKKLYSEFHAERIAWIYAGLFTSFFAIEAFFDSLPAAMMLGALYFLWVKDRPYLASFCIALGAGIKLIPIILIPVLFHKKKQIGPLLMTGIWLSLFFIPLLWYRPGWSTTFFRVSLERPPWETIWAIADQEFGFGYLGPIPDETMPIRSTEELLALRTQSRFSTDVSFLLPTSIRVKIIYAIATLAFLGIFLYSWQKAKSKADIQSWFGFAALIIVLFFIHTKGWSPQFITYVIPILLLAFPDKIHLILLLILINFIEMPIWVFRWPENRWLLCSVVLSRTAVLAYFAYQIWQRFFQKLDLWTQESSLSKESTL